MSIASELTKLETDITNAYDVVQIKGGTIPSDKNTNNLSTAISSIATGIPEQDYTYNQINTPVNNYLTEVTYDPTDYTYSRIANYVQDTTHYRPEGCTFLSNISGVLKISDKKITINSNVSSGNNIIYNITPNSKSHYVLCNSNDAITKTGIIQPTGNLRMIYLNDTGNVRDLGGWSCDGGTVKYGKLFRGGRLFRSGSTNDYDLTQLHDVLRIRHELDLRYSDEIDNYYSLIGADVEYTNVHGAWYALTPSQDCKDMLDVVIDSAIKGIPLYFHCAGGADRTGTLAMFIESLLGMSQSDIDKDYELTSFFSGVSSDDAARRRNENDWINLITAFNTYLGLTIRDRVLAWAITLGISTARINAFRSAMIDGNPETLINPWGTVTVTKTLSNITIDNQASTTYMYESYTATLSANQGYSLADATVTITMGGTDVTSTVYNNGVINIPQATGNIIITATVQKLYTNQITNSKAEIGGSALYNGTGYKNGTRYNSSMAEASATGAFTTGYIQLFKGDVVYLYGDIFAGKSGSFNTTFYQPNGSSTGYVISPYNVNSRYADETKITFMRPLTYDASRENLTMFTYNGDFDEVWVRFTLTGTFDANTTIITINEQA